MPSRVVRAEVLSSRSLANVSLLAEAFFQKLILCVDDFGRLDGRLALIRSVCFPVRDVPLELIEEWLGELETADGTSGPVLRYEVDGAQYLSLQSWEKHRGNQKRAGSSRYPDPPPPSQNDDGEKAPTGNCADSTESTPGTPGISENPQDLRLGGGVGGGGRRGLGCDATPADAGLPPEDLPTAKAKRGKSPPKEPEVPFPEGSEGETCARLYPWLVRKRLAEKIDLRATIEAFVISCEATGKRYVNWDRAIQNAINRDWSCVVQGQTRKPLTADEIAEGRRHQAEGEARFAQRARDPTSPEPEFDVSKLFDAPVGDSHA